MPVRAEAFWDGISAAYPLRLSLLYTKKKKFDRALVPRVSHGLLLDAGCGHGADVSYFANGDFDDVYGIDSSRKMIKSARQIVKHHLKEEVFKRIHLEYGNLKNLRFSGDMFDVTCSFSTIDHIRSEEGRVKAVAELVRVTKPGGTVVLTFPNKYALASMLKEDDEILVSPAEFVHGEITRELVQICNRASDRGAIEYNYETTYSYDDLKKIVDQHDLQESKISTGIMQEHVVVHARKQIHNLHLDEIPENCEILLDQTYGHNSISAGVQAIIEKWSQIPVEQRGLRIGLVAKRPLK